MQTEHCAQRELVRGCHDRKLSLWFCSDRMLDRKPRFVDRDWQGADAGLRQRLARADVTRLLDPSCFTGIEHQPSQQRQTLTHAVRDHDCFRHAGKAAGGAKVLGDGGTQSGMAKWMWCAGNRPGRPPPFTLQQPGPQGEGKSLTIGLPGGEGERRLLKPEGWYRVTQRRSSAD